MPKPHSSSRPTHFQHVKRAPGQGQWNKADLVDHVKTALAVELGTLPIYFCALYSIKRDNGGAGSKARAHILSIAEQEMLHLALAGNMLCSLDGKQALYDKCFMPKYPSQILFDEIPMKLQPANKENLECFLKIEAPYRPPPVPPPEPHMFTALAAVDIKPPHFIPDYRSIGQFYDNVEAGIQELSATNEDLFSSNRSNQLRGSEFFDSKMTVIYDKVTALEALTTIVDQGEGSIGVPESHYTIFVDLYQQHQQWECVDYVDEPSTTSYKNKNEIAYHLSRAVDASYCFLLQTIDRCWKGDVEDGAGRKQLLRNIHQLMVEVLSPTAHILVEQRIGDKFAAPCFEFYPQENRIPLPPKQLFERLKEEIAEALKAVKKATEGKLGADSTDPGLEDSADAIERIAFCLDNFKEA